MTTTLTIQLPNPSAEDPNQMKTVVEQESSTGMSRDDLQDLIQNGSPETLAQFWQNLQPAQVDRFLSSASLDEINSYLSNMSIDQARNFFRKANAKEALYALSRLSDANLQYYANPPTFAANFSLEEGPAASSVNDLLGIAMKAQVSGDPFLAASASSEAAQAAGDTMYEYDIPPAHVNFWGISIAFANWIESINSLMGVNASWSADIAAASAEYAQAESDMLLQAQTGDTWNQSWSGKQSSQEPGTGFETGYYVPGISEIPPGDSNAGYWEAVANQNYQLIQTTYSSWVNQTQSWSQNSADLVQNTSQSTQNDYANINALSQIMANMAALLR